MFTRTSAAVDAVTAHRMAEDDGYVIVDVRTPREWAQGHPPGSILIDLSTLAGRVDELKGKKVLAFCRSGNRSSAATRFLNSHQIETLNISGGILAWTRAGLPLTKGTQQ